MIPAMLNNAEKREIYHALQSDLTDDPIPVPIVRVLEERRHQYRSGEMLAATRGRDLRTIVEKDSR
jgi:hypothetical protein